MSILLKFTPVFNIYGCPHLKVVDFRNFRDGCNELADFNSVINFRQKLKFLYGFLKFADKSISYS